MLEPLRRAATPSRWRGGKIPSLAVISGWRLLTLRRSRVVAEAPPGAPPAVVPAVARGLAPAVRSAVTPSGETKAHQRGTCDVLSAGVPGVRPQIGSSSLRYRSCGARGSRRPMHRTVVSYAARLPCHRRFRWKSVPILAHLAICVFQAHAAITAHSRAQFPVSPGGRSVRNPAHQWVSDPPTRQGVRGGQRPPLSDSLS